MLKGILLDPVQPRPKADLPQVRLERTCTEFESIFITYMLKSMRKSIVEGGLLGKSEERKLFESMFDENFALSISRSGGIGLGKVLFEQLKG